MKICISNFKDVNHYIIKIFTFLLISTLSILLYSPNSFACIKVLDTELEFLANGKPNCSKDPSGRTLTIYNNTDIAVSGSKTNDLDILITGHGNGGYSLHFTRWELALCIRKSDSIFYFLHFIFYIFLRKVKLLMP